MNILFTTHTYAPNNDGVQFVTQYLAEGLVKLGHRVTVVTNLYPDRCNVKAENINGVEVIRINAETIHTIHRGNRNEYIAFIKDNQNNFDIMINVCTQAALTDWLFPIFDKIDIPKILYVHSIWDFKFNRENFKSFKSFCGKLWANIRWSFYYKKWKDIFVKYDAVVQLHRMDYSYKFFKKRYGINSVIIENAAEETFFSTNVNSEIVVPQKYIINVSNYIDRKNQFDCLKAFLTADIPEDWELVLIGSRKTTYYEKLVNYYQNYQKKSSNSRKVHFLYSIPREQISTYVKKASLYIMTSKWEAFPISLVESMAAGVPFISSNVGIVKFFSGGIVADGIERYCYWLNRLTRDEVLRNHYGKMGRYEAFTHFKIDAKVKQLESLLYRCVNAE